MNELERERAAHQQTADELAKVRAELAALRATTQAVIDAANVHMNALRAALEAKE